MVAKGDSSSEAMPVSTCHDLRCRCAKPEMRSFWPDVDISMLRKASSSAFAQGLRKKFGDSTTTPKRHRWRPRSIFDLKLSPSLIWSISIQTEIPICSSACFRGRATAALSSDACEMKMSQPIDHILFQRILGDESLPDRLDSLGVGPEDADGFRLRFASPQSEPDSWPLPFIRSLPVQKVAEISINSPSPDRARRSAAGLSSAAAGESICRRIGRSFGRDRAAKESGSHFQTTLDPPI